MESKYQSLIPNFKQSQPTNEFTLTKYFIISKTYEIFDIYLPHPQTIINKINNNNHNDLITIDTSTFISFYNLQTKTINLGEIDLTLNEKHLKSICCILGGINPQNNLINLIQGKSLLSQLNESHYINNCDSYEIYLQINIQIIFSILTYKEFISIIKALSVLGINFEKKKKLYQTIKHCVCNSNKIMIIIAGSGNFWVKSHCLQINSISCSIRLNKYNNIFLNFDFMTKFFNKIAKHPRVELGIISSMTEKNLSKIIEKIKTECNDIMINDILIFDQSVHENMKECESKPEFLRDFDKIISYIQKQGLLCEYNKSNIIFLESELNKTEYSTEDNSIYMQLFSENNLNNIDMKHEIEYKEDKYINYILHLLDHCTDDVRTYIKESAFHI